MSSSLVSCSYSSIETYALRRQRALCDSSDETDFYLLSAFLVYENASRCRLAE
jgi:hypothetical protein